MGVAECPQCGVVASLCRECGMCHEHCCDCAEFDADEMGLDPEEEYDYGD